MKCAIIRRKEVTLYEKSIKLSAGNVQFLPRLYKIPGSATAGSIGSLIDPVCISDPVL